jgi:hypothetical protein
MEHLLAEIKTNRNEMKAKMEAWLEEMKAC